ncbi:MAG: PKD domain-containing protein [Sphingobacteriaceae bacterium]|nr:PKD domain-containing protein [Sphingobacteriaceae bacterium]
MKTIVKSFILCAIGCITLFSACKKEEYNFGDLKSPTALALNTSLQGYSVSKPTGDGSGNVTINLAADNVINFKVNFGDGQVKMLSPGSHVHKYALPGTFDYVITATANGTGGNVSTITKKITVLTLFDIPANIMTSLTGGTSKIWVADKDAPAHFGIGPAGSFYPEWYAAGPNSRTAPEYNDELSFTKTGANSISFVLDNKGDTFIVPDYAGYYGLGGGINSFDSSGTKTLAFSDATSASTSANSTRVQFMVPDHGLLSWGVGANTYEILSITNTNMFVRSVGADGNAWYQKFKVK